MDSETTASPSPTAANSDHRPQLDGLRFFAFLGVFLFHSNPNRNGAGSLGVHLFFVLSGFLITRILLKNQGPSLAEDLRIFYIRRTLRIFPLYYATLLVIQFVGRSHAPLSSWFYLYNIDCYLRNSFSFLGTTGHFWTLSVEEQFYLVYPLILLIAPARFRLGLLAMLFVACAVSRHLLERFAPNPFTGMLPNVAGELLIAGAIAGYWDYFHPYSTASSIRFFGACVVATWVALWIGGRPIGPSWVGPFVPDAAAGAFATFVWEIWKSRGFLSRILSFGPLVYLGKISYGCYVFHLFVIHSNGWLTEQLSNFGLPGARSLRSLPALVVTIAIAMVSWHLFEAPILSLKSRFRYGGRPQGDQGSGVQERVRLERRLAVRV